MKTFSRHWVPIFLFISIVLCLSDTASAEDIEGTYRMDNTNRTIEIFHIKGDKNKIIQNGYLVSEPGGSWPWAGYCFLDKNKLFGLAIFEGNFGTMMLNGDWNSRMKRITIEYLFTTDKNGEVLKNIGKHSGGRVDHHVWYKTIK